MEVVLASAEGWSEAAQQAALDAVQQGTTIACNLLHEGLRPVRHTGIPCRPPVLFWLKSLLICSLLHRLAQ